MVHFAPVDLQADRSNGRALVVDDEPNISYLVSTALQLNGWDTEVAATGREMLDHVQAFRPEVIVLDVMLPDADGFELCQRLRRESIDTPVIFLTALDATDDRVRGLTIGGDDYLTKPFSVEELVARCRLLLRRVRNEPSRTLQYEELVMDEDAHQVRRGDRSIRLSPTEYKVLRHLMLNAERVLSRRQILDHVWDYDFGGDASNVESYISFLRRKVDVEEPKLIHTVRGVGYVLRVEKA